jgi:hypothetical protein
MNHNPHLISTQSTPWQHIKISLVPQFNSMTIQGIKNTDTNQFTKVRGQDQKIIILKILAEFLGFFFFTFLRGEEENLDNIFICQLTFPISIR